MENAEIQSLGLSEWEFERLEMWRGWAVYATNKEAGTVLEQFIPDHAMEKFLEILREKKMYGL